MGIRRALVLTLLMVASAHAAPARRSPEQRQQLIDLSYALGEMQALRTVCGGADPSEWRGKMNRLIEIETPDEGFHRRLVASFNAGFVTRQAEYPVCRPGALAEERAAALRGRDIARRLSARAP